MNEEWRDIDGYPGYQVSNLGRIRTHNKVTSSAQSSRRVWRDRVMKQKVGKDRGHRIDLWSKDGCKTFLVHRLEAEAFFGKRPGMTVNHIDGDRHNNRIDNLEWLTIGDNIRHAFLTGLISTPKRCALISNDGTQINFRSMSLASRWLGRDRSYLTKRKDKGIAFDNNGQSFRIVI